MKVDNTRVPKGFDRRVKLSEDQKEIIRKRYKEENISLQSLAKEYGVSKSLINFIVNPERARNVKEYQKEHRDRYVQSKERRREYMQNHRDYKRNLIKKGIIKEDGRT